MRRACVLLFAAALFAGEDLEALADQLGSKDLNARNRASSRLMRLRDPKVIPIIEQRIERYPLANQMHGVMVIAAFRPRLSTPALRRLMRSETANIRIAAATQLMLRGQKGAVEVVVTTLTANGVGEPERGYMIQRMRYLRRPEIHAALRTLITKERSVMSIYNIFDALSQDKYSGAQKEARALLTADTRSGPRAVAAAYLVAFGDAGAVDVLAAIIKEGGTDIGSFTRAKNQLIRAGVFPDPIAEAIAERIPAETNESVAALMIEYLGRSGHADTHKWIEGYLDHESGRIVKAALKALTAMKAMPGKELLERLLASKDDERALVAADLLRRMDDTRGFERVLRIARENKDLAREAVTALGEFRRAEAVETLLDRMNHEESIVRSSARMALYRTLTTLFPYRRFDNTLSPYNYQAPEPERKAAIEQIRAWWKEHARSSW